MKTLLLALLSTATLALPASSNDGDGIAGAPSVLFVILDDAGFEDMLPSTMPTLATYAPVGRSYCRFYAGCVCSPSRYAMVSGKLGHRAFIGKALSVTQPFERGAPVSDTMLPEYLAANGYATGLFGKWHVSGAATVPAVDDSARIHGFETWRAGAAGNLSDHYSWSRVDDGARSGESTYSTRAVTDAFVDWWGSTAGGKFACVSFFAPHEPFQSAVPSGMLPPSYPTPTNNRERYLSAITAIDAALVDILGVLDLSNTYVFVFCDNGTPHQTSVWPATPLQQGYKLTPYQGGCNVPLLVFGPGVTPGIDDDLVSIVDLPATVVDLVGLPQPPADFDDSISFTDSLDGVGGSPRQYAWVHRFSPNNGVQPTLTVDRWAIVRDDGMKLLQMDTAAGPLPLELFDLTVDPFEQTDLSGDPAQAATIADLLAERAAILGPGWPY